VPRAGEWREKARELEGYDPEASPQASGVTPAGGQEEARETVMKKVGSIKEVLETPDSIATFRLDDGLIVTVSHFSQSGRVIVRVSRPTVSGFKRYVDARLDMLPRLIEILQKVWERAQVAGYTPRRREAEEVL